MLILCFRKFFLHNWLVNITGRPNAFKEVDLLQEHQNFWAKIVYNAKGVNRSWEWLSRITVCIFALRDAMKQTHATFKIANLGGKHTVPDMNKEVQAIADALEKERIQEQWPDRPWKDQVIPVRDLLEEGAKYVNTRNAFYKFTDNTDTLVATMDSATDDTPTAGAAEEDNGDDVEMMYEVSQDDLAMDEEEPYDMIDTLLSAAEEMVDDMDIDA